MGFTFMSKDLDQDDQVRWDLKFGQITFMFSLKYFTFHRKICQIYELKVRRRQVSVYFLFVFVTFMLVMVSDPGVCFHNCVYLNSVFEFFCTSDFKTILCLFC